MQTITLYRYARADGGVTTSPVMPDSISYDLRYRLIADEGKALTDGATVTTCTDTDDPTRWTEIDDPGELSETEQKAMAYDILTGGVGDESY